MAMTTSHQEMFKPTCSYEEAMEQATGTMQTYFCKAVSTVDAEFGEGYAKKNPHLISTLTSAQVSDFNNCVITKALWEIAEAIQRNAEATYEQS